MVVKTSTQVAAGLMLQLFRRDRVVGYVEHTAMAWEMHALLAPGRFQKRCDGRSHLGCHVAIVKRPRMIAAELSVPLDDKELQCRPQRHEPPRDQTIGKAATDKDDVVTGLDRARRGAVCCHTGLLVISSDWAFDFDPSSPRVLNRVRPACFMR